MTDIKEGTESATGTQLLDRAVSVLRLLGDFGQEGASLSAIGESLGLKQSTTHRIVSALQRHGLVEREQRTKKLRLGLTLFAMGATAADGTGLRRLARPALLRLGMHTGDPAFLMARAGFNAVCVDRHEGSYLIDSLTGYVGGQIPLGVGPAGLAILAFLPEDEAEAVIQANESRYGSYNELSAGKVRASLMQIRDQGYAIDRGELVEGISALAVPILPQGRDAVASIAINMTSPRLSDERLPELLDVMRREVSLIEESLNPLELHRLHSYAAVK